MKSAAVTAWLVSISLGASTDHSELSGHPTLMPRHRFVRRGDGPAWTAVHDVAPVEPRTQVSDRAALENVGAVEALVGK